MSNVLLSIPEAVVNLVELNSPDFIADHLALFEVTAVPGAPRDCAIALYLFEVTGRQVMVNGVYIQDLETGRYWLAPPVLQVFMSRFDAGHYPQLHAPRWQWLTKILRDLATGSGRTSLKPGYLASLEDDVAIDQPPRKTPLDKERSYQIHSTP